jgi:hypothetical protein
MSYFSEPEKKPRSLKVGIALLVFVVIGSTYASNISINDSKRIEFSQGVYTVAACSGWLAITPYTEEYDNGFLIWGFYIEGLDPTKCASTDLRLRAYSNGRDGVGGCPDVANGLLPLYLSVDDEVISEVVLQVGITTEWDSEWDSVGLAAELGAEIRIVTEGIFEVWFSQPLSEGCQLDAITVESSPSGL